MIWGYLTTSEMATASLVNKTWYFFGKKFLDKEILNAVFSGATIKKVAQARIKSIEWVQYNLKAIIVKHSWLQEDAVPAELQDFSSYAIFAVFENVEGTESRHTN